MKRWLALFVLAAGCGEDATIPAGPADGGLADGALSGDAAAPDGGTAPDGGKPFVDLAGPLFDPNHIVEVSITMSPTEWEALRNETRTIGSVIEGACLSKPIESPFTTFEAIVTIDGTTIPRVGIHKKGFFGSLDKVRPSLKIKLDEYDKDKEYLSLDKITLNNGRQDPSLIRQCLTYPLFAAAGLPASRCNYAHVKVNGTDLGVYTHVEAIDKKMIKKRFADGTGPLYEGTLSDFRPLWVNTFDPKGKSGDRTDLVPLVNALRDAPDATLSATIDPLVDIDKFLSFWAMEAITLHWDGYSNNKNNFFVYHDPTSKKLVFIPWGVDATMQPWSTFGNLGSTTGPIGISASSMLARRLFNIPATKKNILDRERALLGSVWKEAALIAEIDRVEKLITPIADPVQGTAWHAGVAQLRTFVNERRAKLTAALDAGPTWTDPLAAYPCLDVKATVEGTFSTTYGTIGAANPLGTGSGTMTITIGGIKTVLSPVGATAGVDGTAPTRSVIQVFGQRASDGHVIVVSMGMPSVRFFPRAFNIGFLDGSGSVLDYNPVTMGTTQVGFILGDLTLTKAATAAGAPVQGSFVVNADQPGSPP